MDEQCHSTEYTDTVFRLDIRVLLLQNTMILIVPPRISMGRTVKCSHLKEPSRSRLLHSVFSKLDGLIDPARRNHRDEKYCLHRVGIYYANN